MEKDQVSRTALSAAYTRGYHAMYGAKKIFEDNLALRLLGDEERAKFDQLFTFPLEIIDTVDPVFAASHPDSAARLAWTMRLVPSTSLIISRSRYTEDALKNAINRQGVRQYVILGAGLDTFAFRHPEMGDLMIFETDHPATQQFKEHRLVELNWNLPKNHHLIPIDFTKESLTAALSRSQYDPSTLSFFSWLGVTYYLPRETVFATLRELAEMAPAGSTIIFDYMDTDIFVPEKAAKRSQMLIVKAREWGEPLITGFDPSKLSEDLGRLGLRLRENLSPSDIQKRYFQGRTDGYYACEHLYFVRAEVE